MPVDLPARKTLNTTIGLHAVFDESGAILLALCFAVALAGLVMHTPRAARAGLSVAVYEAMLLSP